MWLLVVQKMKIGIVFSRDRALQLDATLRSFSQHAGEDSHIVLFALYRTKSPRHAAQYEELARYYRGSVQFVRETAFRKQVLQILGSPSASAGRPRRSFLLEKLWPPSAPSHLEREKPTDYLLFLVDDCLFVRSIRLADAQEALESSPDALGFSFRLGQNTTRSYVLGRSQMLPSFQPVGDGILKYDWTRADADFGYPLEISSSMYRSETILHLLTRLQFEDPNTLESQLSLQARRLARRMPFLLCPEQSVAFSAPMNRVQEVYSNRSAVNAAYAPEALADRFDQGERINVRAFTGFVPSACHQEVGLTFERRTA